MSVTPSHRSADLERLRDEGYDVALVGGTLFVRGIPYVTSDRTVAYGTLEVALRMEGDVTLPPREHAVRWRGHRPVGATGEPLPGINIAEIYGQAQSTDTYMTLCHKPFGREFRDYHELVTGYVYMMGKHATLLDSHCTARGNGGVCRDYNPASPFQYVDTASSRAGTQELTRRLEGLKIAIVGLGGTGSYVLDLVAKTPVASIHLFDDDTFDQHNAFRAPGAACPEEIALRRAKVDHFAAIYSRVHRGIVPHAERMQRGRLGALDGMDFVFLCIDQIGHKRVICDRLAAANVPFVDTGIGLQIGSEGLSGLVRVTTSTNGRRETARRCMPGGRGGTDDAYRTAVQVADLNALNAALAVIRWKRLLGFYRDEVDEHQSVFEVDSCRMYSTTGYDDSER
ncbi:ThiF family adenylyltransferase [Sphingomonas sp. SAFR-052]|uniref:ThiF family adenylyltransferase n=1 Tax=Sphingomonas sp. SAFR-052 TaxID=3436867 RepID=UPI003F80392E